MSCAPDSPCAAALRNHSGCIANAHFELGACIALLRGLAIPFNSFLGITLNAVSTLIASPEDVLSA